MPQRSTCRVSERAETHLRVLALGLVANGRVRRGRVRILDLEGERALVLQVERLLHLAHLSEVVVESEEGESGGRGVKG